MFNNHLMLFLMLPITILYRLLIFIRNLLYDKGVFPAKKAGCPVVSVGNISVGGTGKTPFVIWLAEQFSSRNRNVGILTRGYGRDNKNPQTYIPSDKINDWRDSGDEPFLIHNRLGNVTLAVNANRLRGASAAIDKGNCDLLILDDGFQHRKIHRDIDIVLFDDSDNLREKLLIPSGRLREPLSSLRRADVLVYSGEEKDSARLDKFLKNGCIVCGGKKTADSLVNIHTGNEIEFSSLNNTNISAFCGIGNPEGFRSTLKSAEPKNLTFTAFSDHHLYSESDLNKIRKQYLSSKSKFLVTTEKDSFKLPQNFYVELNVYFLRIKYDVTWGKERLISLLMKN